MPPKDSDSSEDDASFSTTNVLLGYASNEPTNDPVSQLGGLPTWLDPSTPPSAALARCKVCNDMMVQLLQLHADLPQQFPTHERRLHVFTCRRKTCRRKEGSIRVIRGTIIAAPQMKEKSGSKPSAPTPRSDLGTTIFGSGNGASRTNPFATPGGRINPFSTTSTAASNPFSKPSASSPPKSPSTDLPQTFATTLHLAADPISSKPPQFGPIPPPEPWPSILPPPYPRYHLDADYETLDNVAKAVSSTTKISEISEVEEGNSSGKGEKEDSETFESSIDKTFQKFADRLSQNAEQVIRYEFSGIPLLYSKTDSVGKFMSPYQSTLPSSSQEVKVSVQNREENTGIPGCPNCGGPRTFEVQITPHTISELEVDEMDLVNGMEWGTIIVGVCRKDCQVRDVNEGSIGYLEEWCGVQWEERGK